MITIQLKTYQIIALIIAAMFFLFLLFRQCNDANPQLSSERLTIDSLVIAGKYKDSVYRATVTHLNDSIRKSRKKDDSLSKIVSAKGIDLEVSKAKVALLIAKGYAKKIDTTAYLTNCDSLLVENVYLLENIADYQRAQETLVNNQKDLLATMQRVSEVKDSAYKDVKGQLDFIIPKYSKLDYNYRKAEKNANKRFGIGIQGGYTYVTDKFRPVVSIGIHYSLLKF